MDPRSEVLLRQVNLFTGKVLLAGITHDGLLDLLPDSQAWVWLANDAQPLTAQYAERIHFSTMAPSEKFNAAVLYLPKSKELTNYLLQALVACLETNGVLYLVGEKKAGIERASKQLVSYGKAVKLDSARHCQLWRVQPNIPALPANLLSFAQTYSVQGLTITSLAGVFSHGRLDKGTELLLQHLDHLPIGKILDFGCGAGVIGCLLKKQYPKSQLYLQDVDAFAIASSELTLAQNNLAATTLLADGIDNAPLGLNAIITNPPFHQGVQTHYQTTEQLLLEASHHLLVGGELRLVANSFLKYQPLIHHSFGNCQVLAESNGFKIYSARKQK